MSLGLIVAYIWMRFDLKFAGPVIAALLHDIVITVGVYSVTGRVVTTATVAAVLTVLGYSIYDTIIIFDRVRENIPLMRRASFATLCNVSLWETIRRSLATTFITLLPVGSLFFFGGTTLKDFAFALLVGITSGAYSSIFIAAPLLTMWKEREPEYARRKARRGARTRTPAASLATAATERARRRGRSRDAEQAAAEEPIAGARPRGGVGPRRRARASRSAASGASRGRMADRADGAPAAATLEQLLLAGFGGLALTAERRRGARRRDRRAQRHRARATRSSSSRTRSAAGASDAGKLADGAGRVAHELGLATPRRGRGAAAPGRPARPPAAPARAGLVPPGGATGTLQAWPRPIQAGEPRPDHRDRASRPRATASATSSSGTASAT